LNENQAQTLKRFRHLKFNKIFFAARICQHKKKEFALHQSVSFYHNSPFSYIFYLALGDIDRLTEI